MIIATGISSIIHLRLRKPTTDLIDLNYFLTKELFDKSHS